MRIRRKSETDSRRFATEREPRVVLLHQLSDARLHLLDIAKSENDSASANKMPIDGLSTISCDVFDPRLHRVTRDGVRDENALTVLEDLRVARWRVRSIGAHASPIARKYLVSAS